MASSAGEERERSTILQGGKRSGGRLARRSVLHERKEEVRRLWTDGVPDAEIGETFGASASAVRSFRQREGMVKARGRVWDTREVARWAAEGRSDAWIAERVGASPSAVQSYRFKNGISRRYPKGKLDTDVVKNLVAEGKSDANIGERFGVSAGGVAGFRSRHGIKRPEPADYWSESEVGELKRLFEEGCSDAHMGARLGRSEAAVGRARRRHGLTKKGTLKGREADVRGWVREGRTDKWIAERLGATAPGVAAFRSREGLRKPLGGGRAASARNRGAVIRAMRGGPVAGYAAFRERTGLSPGAVRRHLRELEREGIVVVAWSDGHPGRPMVARLAEAKDPSPR